MAETKVGKRNFITDMTSGNITKLLLTFALPLLVGNVFQQLYNMVDSVIVGRYVGPIALGAVGSVGSVNFLLFSLCFGLSNGVGIVISQIFGAKDYARLKRYVANAFYVTFIVGIITTIIAELLAEPILRFMNTPPENFGYALAYMRIICAGVWGVWYTNGLTWGVVGIMSVLRFVYGSWKKKI